MAFQISSFVVISLKRNSKNFFRFGEIFTSFLIFAQQNNDFELIFSSIKAAYDLFGAESLLEDGANGSQAENIKMEVVELSDEEENEPKTINALEIYSPAQPNTISPVIPFIGQPNDQQQQPEHVHSVANSTMNLSLLPHNFDQSLWRSSFFLRGDGTLFDLTSILNGSNGSLHDANALNNEPHEIGQNDGLEAIVANADGQVHEEVQCYGDEKTINTQSEVTGDTSEPKMISSKPNSSETSGEEGIENGPKCDEVITIGESVDNNDGKREMAPEMNAMDDAERNSKEHDKRESAQGGKKFNLPSQCDSSQQTIALTAEPEPSTSKQSSNAKTGGKSKRKHSDANASRVESSKWRKT